MIKIVLPFPPSVNSLFGGGSKQKRFPSKTYKMWKAACPELPRLGIDYKIHIEYTFYWPDKRVRDGQGSMKAVTDKLVRSGVIVDDNGKIIDSETWKNGGIDRGTARVDIQIAPLD